MKQEILLFITDAGGGHRAAARSLVERAKTFAPELNLTIQNVYDDPWPKFDPVRRFGIKSEDIYNFMLQHSLEKLARPARVIALKAAERELKKGRAQAAMADFIRRKKPALCVSLMPFVNEMLMGACLDAGVPMGLVCTDMMDQKPYMWFSKRACEKAAFVSVACDEARSQAQESGAGARAEVLGLPLAPKYFDPAVRGISQEAARSRMGLEQKTFTVALSGGGQAGSSLEDLVRELDGSGERWQVIACCGRNESLLRRLQALKGGLRNLLHPLGFTEDMPYVLKSADLLICKPGPATLMEAVSLQTPMLLDDRRTMPQERPNARWAVGKGLAGAVKEGGFLPAATEHFKNPSHAQSMRRLQAEAAPVDTAQSILERIKACLSVSTRS